MVALHEKRLRKCLSKVKGIDRVEIEGSIQKVVVTGYANRNKILKALRRVGLRAEPWSPHNEILSTYASTKSQSLRMQGTYLYMRKMKDPKLLLGTSMEKGLICSIYWRRPQQRSEYIFGY
ncbi:hypothetical protein FCM35_KLT04495 [Carex littledalei]|uniref:HMA domain-containing protein n=1 Tax=Carex littledalei TaxID=544730 RepID=A0A833R0U2_9POAL|nr:hypothetical protein FCM35_KLT04495 [Carex littledalei]